MIENAYALIGQLVIIGAEIYFIIWTVKNTKKNRETNELLKEKVDQLYRERHDDFIKTEKMQNQINELEKQIKKSPE